jgi:hypothetical protein
MSIWYQLNVTAMSANGAAVAKFFNLDNSMSDVRTDTFEFSFGGKNAPSLTLRKIMEQNPDLIFLINQNIECDTRQWFLMRFDPATAEQQMIRIQDFGAAENKLNKKILEEYTKELPTLPVKHLEGQKGFEDFRWTMFFNFEKADAMLKHSQDYKEMVNPFEHFKIKTYVLEYEFYGSKEWDGPMPITRLNERKKKLASIPEITNIIVREAGSNACIGPQDLEFDNAPLDEE